MTREGENGQNLCISIFTAMHTKKMKMPLFEIWPLWWPDNCIYWLFNVGEIQSHLGVTQVFKVVNFASSLGEICSLYFGHCDKASQLLTLGYIKASKNPTQCYFILKNYLMTKNNAFTKIHPEQLTGLENVKNAFCCNFIPEPAV